MNKWALLVTGSLLGALSLVGAVSALLGYMVTMNEAEPGFATVILLLDGLAILAGLRLIGAYPVVGVGLVMGAAFVFSMAWQWTILGPLLAILLVVLSVRMTKTSFKNVPGNRGGEA